MGRVEFRAPIKLPTGVLVAGLQEWTPNKEGETGGRDIWSPPDSISVGAGG